MKFSSLFMISIASILAWFGCKTPQIEAPDQSKITYTTPPRLVSGIAAPVRVNLKEVGQSLNSKFKGMLFQDLSFDDNGKDQLKLNISKRNDFQISGSGNSISITAPLQISGVYRLQQRILGIDINKEQPFNLSATIVLNSIPSVDQSWNLNLKSKTQVRWEDLPTLEIGNFKLDFPSLFASIIQNQSDKISQFIDKEIPKQVNLRAQAQKNWEYLKAPLLLDEKTNSWLKISPRQAYLSPIQVSDSMLTIQTGLSSVIEVVSGKKPDSESPTVSLPELKTGNNLKEEVNLNLMAEVPFSQINEQLKNKIGASGYMLESSDYKIIIREAQAFPYGEKLLLGLKLDGKVKKSGLGKNINGVVYLEGKPVFNSSTKEIEVQAFDFNLKTRDLLVKSASWLLNSKSFKSNLEQQMRFNLSKQLDDAKLLANQALNKSYGQNLVLNGSVERIEPGTVFITPDAVKVQVTGRGKIGILLRNF